MSQNISLIFRGCILCVAMAPLSNFADEYHEQVKAQLLLKALLVAGNDYELIAAPAVGKIYRGKNDNIARLKCQGKWLLD